MRYLSLTRSAAFKNILARSSKLVRDHVLRAIRQDSIAYFICSPEA
ncbi:unnamed protein product [Schistosoma mattheei]|uniref:Uncharacterized protein n=1 Tax=Schistosoma mattheei TaxID=31246 RepID=A0A183Q3X8_9TREM|nr:unnamed protein product [Schistosoma mattheei]